MRHNLKRYRSLGCALIVLLYSITWSVIWEAATVGAETPVATGAANPAGPAQAQPETKTDLLSVELDCPDCQEKQKNARAARQNLIRLQKALSRIEQQLTENAEELSKVDEAIKGLEARLKEQENVGASSTDPTTGITTSAYDNGEGYVVVTEQRPGQPAEEKYRYPRRSTGPIQDALKQKREERQRLKTIRDKLQKEQQQLQKDIAKAQSRFDNLLAELAGCVDQCHTRRAEELARAQAAEVAEQAAAVAQTVVQEQTIEDDGSAQTGDTTADTAATQAQAPSLEELRAEAGRQYTLKLDESLTLQMYELVGDKDDKGYFLDPTGTFFNGDPLSKGFIKALLLVRTVLVLEMSRWIDRLNGYLRMSDEEKISMARSLRNQAPELLEAYQDMNYIEIFARNPYNPRTGRPQDWESIYNDQMREADRLEKRGDKEGAEALRQEANSNVWGIYLEKRATFLTMLENANPLLAIQYDGYFSNPFFFESLRDENISMMSTEDQDAKLLDLFNQFITFERDRIIGKRDEIRNETEVEDLIELADGKYYRIHEIAAKQGLHLGSTYAGDIIGEMQAVQDFLVVQNQFWDGLKDGTIGVLATASWLIPVAGPFISGGFAAIQIYRDGDEMVVRYLDAEEAHELANVTGHVYTATADDLARAARGEFFFTLVTSIGELAGLSGIRYVKGTGATDDVMDTAGTVARAGGDAVDAGADTSRALGGLPQSEVNFWLQTVDEAGRVDLLKNELANLDDVVKRYQQLGVPDEQINAALQRARAEGKLTQDVVNQLETELIMVRANEQGLVVAIHPDNALDFLKFSGGVPADNLMRVDLTMLADIRTKAALEAAGKPQVWTQAEIDMINNTILPAGNDALKWMGFNPLQRLDAADVGLVQLFNQESLDDINRLMAQGGPTRMATDTPPGGGPGAIDTETPTWMDRTAGQSDGGSAGSATGTPAADGSQAAVGRTDQFGPGQVHEGQIDTDAPTVIERTNRESGTGTWGSPRSGQSAQNITDDMILTKARIEARGDSPNWTGVEAQRLRELSEMPAGFRSSFGHQLTEADIDALQKAAKNLQPTERLRLEMPAPASDAAGGGAQSSTTLGSAVPLATGLSGGALAYGGSSDASAGSSLTPYQSATGALISGYSPEEVGAMIGRKYNGAITVAAPHVIAANETRQVLETWNFSPQTILKAEKAAIQAAGGSFSDALAQLNGTTLVSDATSADVDAVLATWNQSGTTGIEGVDKDSFRIGADYQFGDNFSVSANYDWNGWNNEEYRADLRLEYNPLKNSALSYAYIEENRPAYATGYEVSWGSLRPFSKLNYGSFKVGYLEDYADDGETPADEEININWPTGFIGLGLRKVGHNVLARGGTVGEAAAAIGYAYDDMLWEADAPPIALQARLLSFQDSEDGFSVTTTSFEDRIFDQAVDDTVDMLLEYREEKNISILEAAGAMMEMTLGFDGTLKDFEKGLNVLLERWPGLTVEQAASVGNALNMGFAIFGNPFAVTFAFDPQKGVDSIPNRGTNTIDPIWVVEITIMYDQASSYPNDPLYPKNGQWNKSGSVLKKGIGGLLKAFNAPVSMDKTLASNQWSLPATGFTPKGSGTSAWDVADGSEKNIIVAVLDSGLDTDLEDGPQYLWINEDEIPGNHIDDDANGYVDDIHGWNFLAESNDFDDDFGHGTFVSGIIAARTNNGVGMAGINPGARIMPLKVLDTKGRGNSLSVYRAIRYAVDNGAKVLNLSLAGKKMTPLVQTAVNYAYSMGAIVVVAAGNSSTDIAGYAPPGAHRAFSVASMNMDGKRRDTSNWGLNVALAAPGESIYSLRATVPETAGSLLPIISGKYVRLSGTSYSSPIVAGIASLIWSKDPTLSNRQVEDLMLQTARDILEPGWDPQSGSGLVNAHGALTQETNDLLAPRITHVTVNKRKRKVASVDVYGVVRGNVKHYSVEVGRGKKPKKWETAYGPATKPVDHGLICRLPETFFKKGSSWTVRLTAVSNEGRTETRTALVSKK